MLKELNKYLHIEDVLSSSLDEFQNIIKINKIRVSIHFDCDMYLITFVIYIVSQYRLKC